MGMELMPNDFRCYRQKALLKKHCSGGKLSTQMMEKARFVVPEKLQFCTIYTGTREKPQEKGVSDHLTKHSIIK